MRKTVPLVLALGLAPSLAAAAQPVHFDIRTQALSSALVEFALQAGVSVNSAASAGCRPTRGISGTFSPDAALRRLLDGTGCAFRTTRARTIEIIPERRRGGSAIPRRDEASTPSPALPEPIVDELFVTAPRRTVGLSRAPYALTAVTGEELIQAGVSDASELSGRVAGLTFTHHGPGRNKVFVRGLADSSLSGRTQSTVGIYLDEARLTYNAPDPDLRLVDIERVEVLRGPQGALYGAGSIGGILQIVTRPPDLEMTQGFGSASVEPVSEGRTGRAFEAGLNLPLIPGRLAVRAVGYSETAGGFIDNRTMEIVDADRTRREGVRIAGRLQINEDWSASLKFIDQTIHADDSHYADGSSGAYARQLSVREPHRNDFDGLTALLEGDLGWARLKLSTASQHHDLDSRFDATAVIGQFDALAVGPARFDDGARIKAFVSEATLSGNSGASVSWIGGLFSAEYTQRADRALTPQGVAQPIYFESRKDHIDEYAAFGEATLNPTGRWRMTLGGRLYSLSVETEGDTAQPRSARVSSFSGKATYDGFAPKALLEYDLTSTILAYAQASEGYRSGGFNTGGLADPAVSLPRSASQPARSFRGDELWNYEVGARARLLDGAVRLRIATFLVKWRDIQSDRLLPSGLPFTANIGDGSAAGVEAEVSWRREGLRIDASLSLNDPEISRPDPGFPATADRHFPGVATSAYNLSAQYQWKAGRGTASLEAAAGYVGRSALAFDPRTTREMGGYWTSRISASWFGGDWRLAAFVENPANSQGDTFAFGNPFSLAVTDQSTPQAPRTAGVVLSRRY